LSKAKTCEVVENLPGLAKQAFSNFFNSYAKSIHHAYQRNWHIGMQPLKKALDI
jgi:hypothetical protein